MEPNLSVTAKKPFYENVMYDAHAAGQALLKEHPELHAVCVVPIWTIQGNLPSGVVVIREQTEMNDGLLHHLFGVFSNFLRDVAFQFIKAAAENRSAAARKPE